jgi:K(+)-stimulated pyrophosphate-energized sodium pump
MHGVIHVSPPTVFESQALWVIWCIAILALLYAFYLMREVLSKSPGSKIMQDISKSVQEGANAYLARQFKTIALLTVILAIVLMFTSGDPDPAWDMKIRIGRGIAFLVGATFSALTGFVGMSLTTRANARVAHASLTSKKEALTIAFRTGAIAGMFTIGLGLFGATTIFMIFLSKASEVLVGFGFGGCLLALFMRVGGGIYTKAADVGADLVGKVEKNIPEDDPRNPATIADNVGDNVGDCAGMAADIFESYEVTLVAAMILGAASFGTVGVIFPLMLRAIGVLTSIIGTYFVKAKDETEHAMKPINRGFFIASTLSIIGFALVTHFYLIDGLAKVEGLAGSPHVLAWKLFLITTIGILLSFVISKLTEYFTSTENAPVKEVAKATLTGHATTIIQGFAEGMESSVWAIISIATAIAASILIFGVQHPDQILYGVSLLGLGMLTVTGIIVSEDSYGPVSDNAQGIGEMSHMSPKERKILDELDAVGNSTKAITKGFAIATAVIAAVSLFSSYNETIINKLSAMGQNVTEISFNVADPVVFVGILIGGAVPFLFASLLIRAVGRAASLIVNEVRRQFKEIKGLMQGKAKPDAKRVVDICTSAALKELIGPWLLAILTPVIVGLLLSYKGLAGYLVGTILVGQLLAVFLANSGGAWDNAKKLIENGLYGGKGSEAHKASVTGDTVGDPFKDTAGPALNPLIKVMNLVSLIIAPILVGTSVKNPVVIGAILAGILIIGIAIWFSKREDTSGIAAEVAAKSLKSAGSKK